MKLRKGGAKFIIATLSTVRQVEPDPAVRREIARRNGVGDLLYPDQCIKTLGECDGFTVVNLAQPMPEYAEKNKVFLHAFGDRIVVDTGTLKERLAGEKLSEALCKTIETSTAGGPFSSYSF